MEMDVNILLPVIREHLRRATDMGAARQAADECGISPDQWQTWRAEWITSHAAAALKQLNELLREEGER